MKTLQPISATIGIVCAALALSTSTGCPIVEPGEPATAVFFLPVMAALGLGCGILTRVRGRTVDRHLWDVVDDSTLTTGERELAHREAASEKKTAAVMFLAAPIGLGLWLAYQFKGETLGTAELLVILPMLAFGLGLWIGGFFGTAIGPPR